MRIVSQHGDLSPRQGVVEPRGVAEGLAGQAQFAEHKRNPLGRVVSGLPLGLVFFAAGLGRRQDRDFAGALGVLARRRPQGGRGLSRRRRRRGIGGQ